VGVAVFGAIVNATLGGAGVPNERVPPGSLSTAVHHVFLATAVVAVVLLAAVLLMPRERGPLRTPVEDTSEAAAA
jgi:hypothetical protein